MTYAATVITMRRSSVLAPEERHGCNSIKWCMLRFKDIWAMNCALALQTSHRKTASVTCAIWDKRN